MNKVLDYSVRSTFCIYSLSFLWLGIECRYGRRVDGRVEKSESVGESLQQHCCLITASFRLATLVINNPTAGLKENRQHKRGSSAMIYSTLKCVCNASDGLRTLGVSRLCLD